MASNALSTKTLCYSLANKIERPQAYGQTWAVYGQNGMEKTQNGTVHTEQHTRLWSC